MWCRIGTMFHTQLVPCPCPLPPIFPVESSLSEMRSEENAASTKSSTWRWLAAFGAGFVQSIAGPFFGWTKDFLRYTKVCWVVLMQILCSEDFEGRVGKLGGRCRLCGDGEETIHIRRSPSRCKSLSSHLVIWYDMLWYETILCLVTQSRGTCICNYMQCNAM